MGLAIGFTEKYYTLWSISTSVDYQGCQEYGYTKTKSTTFSYIQNLSMDEASAINKARSMGCEDLTPDMDLYGRYSSFVKKEVMEKWTNNAIFQKGKYMGVRFDEGEDLNYLLWYKTNVASFDASKEINKALVKKWGFVNLLGETPSEDYDGLESLFATKEEAKRELEAETLYYIKEDFRESLLSKPIIEGTFDRNLRENGYGNMTVTNENGISVSIIVKFPNIRENYYNGYTYYLPVNEKDKQKRIKNKKVTIVLDKVYTNSIEETVYKVKTFVVSK